MKRGFTLIELLLVLAILAALAAIILPTIVGWSDTSKESTTKGNLHTLKVAFEAYYLDNGEYPPDDGNTLEVALSYLAGAKFGITNKDDYLNDAWGIPFTYDLNDKGKLYIIWSDAAVGDDDNDGTSGTYQVGSLDSTDSDSPGVLVDPDELGETGVDVDDLYETNAPIQ